MTSEQTDRNSREQAVYFRNKLRAARDAVLGDGESYRQVLFVVEQLGRQKWPEKEGLRSLKCDFADLVRESHPFDGRMPGDTDFEIQYEIMRKGRNDAMHIGAVARSLAASCVKLSIILEDALMESQNSRRIKDYMVCNPVCTYEWQRVALIRQTMLKSSFSYLPFRTGEREWFIVSADNICRYLRRECSRKHRLAKALSDARKDGLTTEEAKTVGSEDSIESVIQSICGDKPFLVIHEDTGELMGLANSFDLM